MGRGRKREEERGREEEEERERKSAHVSSCQTVHKGRRKREPLTQAAGPDSDFVGEYVRASQQRKCLGATSHHFLRALTSCPQEEAAVHPNPLQGCRLRGKRVGMDGHGWAWR